VSVVIPTYNGARHLAETIDSVRRQRLQDWELIVYDDGSSDDSVAVARRAAADDARVRVVEGANGGVAAARNAGFARTDPRSRYVAFLDHDDVWQPDALETLGAVLDTHPELVAAHGTAVCIGDDGRRPEGDDVDVYMRNRMGFHDGHLVPRPLTEPTTFADLAFSNWILTPGTLLMRRQVAEHVGGFDGAVVPADDWDMALRLSRRGDVGFVDRTLLHWRRHGGAQSYAAPGYGRSHLRVRHKMLVDPDNSPAQLKAARQGYAHTTRATADAARHALRQRDLRQAVRQVAKAAWQAAWYARSEVDRLFERRRRSRPVPASR
jgi:glycosyltransferase involved in cell wall biosynthesis